VNCEGLQMARRYSGCRIVVPLNSKSRPLVTKSVSADGHVQTTLNLYAQTMDESRLAAQSKVCAAMRGAVLEADTNAA
jgi:hypothetical protein